MKTGSITARLARFVADPDPHVPEAVLCVAASQVADTVGCALAGAQEPAARIAAEWLAQLRAFPQASLWGRPAGGPPADVAMANGTAAHALDFDDSLPAMRGHAGAVIVPAALAVGEAQSCNGREVLEAIAMGLETGGFLGRLIGEEHYLRGWHMTGTIGAFAATAVAARLMALSPEQLRMAWGLAASQSSGLVRNFGTMTKPFHAGHAARTGILSAWMARAGMTAATDIFDGDRSFVRMYGGGNGADPERLLTALGDAWMAQVPGVYVKRWPCCYCSHRAIGGLQELMRQEGISADDIESVDVGFLPGSDEGLVSSRPTTGLEAKFSVEYALAAMAVDGELTIESFTDDRLRRPSIQALMARIRRYRIDAEGIWSGVTGHTDIAVRTRKGTHERRIEHTPGSPAWPMSGEDRRAKFAQNAARTVDSRRAERLYERLSGLVHEASVAKVLKEAWA